MTFAGGLILGLVIGCLVGELVAVGSLAVFHWAAEKRDSVLTDGDDA